MFCDYLCVYRVGCSPDDLGEDDPVGWFELEEEWDEADVKLQQCRVAKVSSSESRPSCTCPPHPCVLCLSSAYCVPALGQPQNPGGKRDMIMTHGKFRV